VTLAAAGALKDVVVVADQKVLADRAHTLGLQQGRDIAFHTANDWATAASKTLAPASCPILRIWHHPCPSAVVAGELNIKNARYVLDCLDGAIEVCRQGEASALVTAPVQKSIIADSGIPFTGHTEYLAEKTLTSQVVMMLVGGGLRVALATTHLPLSQVSAAITPELLDEMIEIVLTDLQQKFGIASPHLLVAGLNPHAGEGGHLGHEDQEIILPAIDRARTRGANITGPLPADTLFTPGVLAEADAVLAMYHDQGLPVLKMLSFGGGVNITLGLPFIRTSVDHGTALDLAGSGRAETGSLSEALVLARALVLNKKSYSDSRN
jgi:4-hydroxythreonine-4-phosphate dehydrogenase